MQLLVESIYEIVKWLIKNGSAVLLLGMLQVQAQKNDTIFSVRDLLQYLRTEHPLAQQAQLPLLEAAAQLNIAKGAFIPKIYGSYDRKVFGNKLYYSIGEAMIKMPTAFYGLEAKAGFQHINGSYINPENKIPAAGLGFVGFEVPLIKGRATDARRAALQQAELQIESSNWEQRALLNDLWYDALARYIEWWGSYEQMQIASQAVSVAKERLEMVRRLAALGDRAAIDTTEAALQWQSRLYEWQELRLSTRQTAIALSNFIWLRQQNQPLLGWQQPQLSAADIPLYLLEDTINVSAEWASRQPLLQLYQYKMQQLEIERRLKRESLKPELNIGYNLLTPNADNTWTWEMGNVRNFYKIGVSVGLPFSWQPARAALQLTNLKLTQTQQSLQIKQQELIAKRNTYYAEWEQLNQQLRLQNEMLANYRRLFEGEQTRYNIGESTLFLLNARENKVLETLMKIKSLEMKIHKAKLGLQWASGELYRL